MNNLFQKAIKKNVRLKIAITGPSGSGKTTAALNMAQGIGAKIAFIDTEAGSASLYSDRVDFDTLELGPPFTIDKYIKGIEAAEQGGYDVLIIDSISHAWAGEGGLLDKKSAFDNRGGNQYTNWAPITKEQEQFKSAFLHSPLHIICTMRSKQEYIIEANDKGKSVPKKVGLAPIQREGVEYEFTAVLDLAMDHNATASKDRTGLFDNKIFSITPDTGKALMKWLENSVEVEQPKSETKPEPPKVEKPKTSAKKTPDEALKFFTEFKTEDKDVNAYFQALSKGEKWTLCNNCNWSAPEIDAHIIKLLLDKKPVEVTA